MVPGVRSQPIGQLLRSAPFTTADPVDPYWATWVFLAVLGGLTAFMLWLWTGNWKKWRSLLPAPNPDGWSYVDRFVGTRAGAGGLELGSDWRSLADPRAVWTLSWEPPGVLIAQRRPAYPPPPGGTSGVWKVGPRDYGYRGLCVLLTGVTGEMAGEVTRRMTRFEGRADGADHVVDFLIDAGAVPTGPAFDLLTTEALQAWRAARARERAGGVIGAEHDQHGRRLRPGPEIPPER